jgi:predicted pyridoxine 5'-phosphate oxidase superfamily flavin-nucleotide-binding protein
MDRPGSDGERDVQADLGTEERDVQADLGTEERAEQFYDGEMHDYLTERMQSFVGERILCFLSTADANGETNCSPRLGPPGFVQVLDDDRLCYPEFRGNGVQASLGNIRENPHASLLFVDWWDTTVGLHVNGDASIREEMPEATDPTNCGRVKCWVELHVEEAYIHCAKHLPRLEIAEFDPPWGTDDADEKKSGFFEE